MNNEPVFNYYIVQAKCGHVGKGKYIPIDFPIKAKNARLAAFYARKKPGVKHNHSNAILSVREVSFKEFLSHLKKFKEDLYWQRARRNYEALLFRVKDEDPFYYVNKPSTNNYAAKINKKASKAFRVKRNKIIERSLDRDIIDEYKVSA